jgi:uncharacterized membrane protein
MSLYRVALFVHIIGAVVLVGTGFIAPLVLGGAGRAGTVASFRDWIGVMQKISKSAGISALLVFLSGLYMGLTESLFSQAWLVVSLVLFVINGGLASGVLDKWLGRLQEQAAGVAGGPVTPELRTALHEPRLQVVEKLMLGNDFVIVFLMTNKPGLTGALIAIGVGLAFTAALVARGRTRSGAAVPAG